jgi:hypothetical protein
MKEMRRLSPIGLATKWLLVPGMLGCIGYFAVGQNVGSSPFEIVAKASERKTSLEKTVEKTSSSGPSIEVEVVPVRTASVEITSKPERRVRRTETPKAKPKPVEEPETAPEPEILPIETLPPDPPIRDWNDMDETTGGSDGLEGR